MKYIIYLLIFFNVLLASRWLLDGNILFHTDIARDFLLVEDIVENKNLTLIGPRSGAIPGLFHGPLWLYLNLPAFVIGDGNPVFIGWFWVSLYVLSLFVIYWVGKKMFDENTGVLSALMLSSVTILYARSLFNPYGALILFPVYFFAFSNYLKNANFKTLFFALFILGLIIQFQMAFGVPVLILTFVYLIIFLYKNKKLFLLLIFSILAIPLLSFIIFEIRNNFLQIRSVIDYLWGSQTHGKLESSFLSLIMLRVKQSVTDGLGTIAQNNIYLTAGLFLSLIFKNRDRIYFLFVYFYLGFWILTIFFKGPLWNYYYLPFIPLLILIFVSLKNEINKVIFYTLFVLIYFVNLQHAINDINSYNLNPKEQDLSTWKFNQLVAQKVYENGEKEFGYFIFTPDLYGYSPRYAMNFYKQRYKDKSIYPYQKKKITYLLIAPPPSYGSDPNSIWYQKNINSASWKINDIRINKDPKEKVVFPNGFVIERYELTPEEISIEPNPNLIKDIFFR